MVKFGVYTLIVKPDWGQGTDNEKAKSDYPDEGNKTGDRWNLSFISTEILAK